MDVRAKVEAELIDKREIRIFSDAFSSSLICREKNGSLKCQGPPELKILASGLIGFLRKLPFEGGLDIKVSSRIPIGSGMGSSASVSASLIKAVSEVIGERLVLNELLEEVYRMETLIHGKASKTGPACAVYGGLIKISWGKEGMKVKRRPGFPKIPLLMAWSGRETSTKEMILRVREISLKYKDVFKEIASGIEKVTIEGERALERSKWDEAGRLMVINHGLLWSLGVSTIELDEIVYTSIRSGAEGAKLSGGGGGGCVVILASDPDKRRSVTKALQLKGYIVFEANLASRGVVVEKIST